MRILILLLTLITFASLAMAQDTKDKVEIGVQTTSLTVFYPDVAFDDTKGGIGGRVTYNFNRSLAAEAELNFFPQKQLIFESNGRSIQGQFGVKIGKRFEKFGLFAKVRPGFISAGDVVSFKPEAQVPPTIPSKVTVARETFFTVDLGGVLELYPSRRLVVRFDAGDTVIRHPERFVPFGFGGPLVRARGPKLSHNFQLTAGVGFRLGDFPDEEPDVDTAGEMEKRFEVGVQFTSLFVDPSNSQGSIFFPRIHTEPGFGGRLTYNLTESIAFEAEGNYFTREQFGLPEGGKMFQGQFGGKIGKRFDRWGVFGKARPGFVGFTRVLQSPFGVPLPPFSFERRLYPSVDLGGVVEFYVSPRWLARFDVGDTIIRYGEIEFAGFPPSFTVPSVTRHNLQVSTGIGFRF
ncbi:MAG TPA: outer membrane beta-barrel protein [Pyrinomonadaceae bacterium]|nr:outer membrane beta-barrel protein [Pyrinomonadaceae bacterium]